MRFTIIISALFASAALAAPMVGSGTLSALQPRQSTTDSTGETNNAGSTSTSTSNNNGLLNLGLTSSGAAAAEDGATTSSTTTSSCGKHKSFSNYF